MFDCVFKRLLGKGARVLDVAEGVVHLVQGFAVAGMAGGQLSLLLSRGGQVPAGQFRIMVGEFFLALGGTLGEPRGYTVLEEVVMHAPKVSVEGAFGG